MERCTNVCLNHYTTFTPFGLFFFRLRRKVLSAMKVMAYVRLTQSPTTLILWVLLKQAVQTLEPPVEICTNVCVTTVPLLRLLVLPFKNSVLFCMYSSKKCRNSEQFWEPKPLKILCCEPNAENQIGSECLKIHWVNMIEKTNICLFYCFF